MKDYLKKDKFSLVYFVSQGEILKMDQVICEPLEGDQNCEASSKDRLLKCCCQDLNFKTVRRACFSFEYVKDLGLVDYQK